MRSVPTTSLDLFAPDVVADPYPHFARERERHAVAWHEAWMYLTFAHAAVGTVQRDRRLGRLWRDRTPEARFEPFNLLHRNQMMENEPPEHTRLRRPVARAFARGHIERLRPRVRELRRLPAGRGRRRPLGELRRHRGHTPSRCRCW